MILKINTLKAQTIYIFSSKFRSSGQNQVSKKAFIQITLTLRLLIIDDVKYFSLSLVSSIFEGRNRPLIYFLTFSSQHISIRYHYLTILCKRRKQCCRSAMNDLGEFQALVADTLSCATSTVSKHRNLLRL